MKAKSVAKKMTIATVLASSLFSGSFSQTPKTPFDNLQQEVAAMRSLTQEGKIADIFNALSHLSNTISEVTLHIEQNQFKMKRDKFNLLLVIRELLDINSNSLVEKYEDEIWQNYAQVYRQYSLTISQLDMAIYRIKERLDLIQVVEIDDLTLTESELKEIADYATQYWAEKGIA